MRRRLRPPARAITLTGFMGTGKSSVGWSLSRRLGLPLVDTDDLVEENARMTIPEIFARHGEEYFRDIETAALRQALENSGIVLSTGGGILLRPENVQLLREAGPIICLQASPETILRRTSRSNQRPLLQTSDPLQRIKQLLDERAEAYALADYHVDTDHDDQERTTAEIIGLLKTDPRTVYLITPVLRVKVNLGREAYIICVGAGLLGKIGELYPPPVANARCVVISTDVIARYYADRTVSSLRAAGWRTELLTVPDGEASKCWETAGKLLHSLADIRLDRGGTVFALGGGVIGDLAGFVASVYMRGVDYVQLPTSLLAQVDASIGGKVAVDLPQGKNLVGSFYQPEAVFIDTDTLTTLPDREFRAGLAEVIKHAVIADPELFNYLRDARQQILDRDTLAMKYVLARNCQIKADIVEQDPKDKGLRYLLNLGHTVGHAIERAARNWELRHGEAVAIGLVADMRLAARLELASRDTADQVEQLIGDYGLPTRMPEIDLEAVQTALAHDKKIVHGSLSIPLVSTIGSARVYKGINLAHVQAVVEELLT